VAAALKKTIGLPANESKQQTPQLWPWKTKKEAGTSKQQQGQKTNFSTPKEGERG